MYITDESNTWNLYLEINCRGGSPVKLNKLLKRRRKAFMKARRASIVEGIRG